MMSNADDTARKVCEAMVAEHAKLAEYFCCRDLHKYRLEDTVLVERHLKDALSRHRQQSWYLPGVILRKTGQDVYVIQVGSNKTVERDHTRLLPQQPDTHSRAMTFEITSDTFDSDDDGQEDEYTADCILLDKPDPDTPGGQLYNFRWKGFAASRESWEPPSSFVPWHTSVRLDYLKAKSSRMSSRCWFTWSRATVMEAITHNACLFLHFNFCAVDMYVPWLRTARVSPIPISST